MRNDRRRYQRTVRKLQQENASLRGIPARHKPIVVDADVLTLYKVIMDLDYAYSNGDYNTIKAIRGFMRGLEQTIVRPMLSIHPKGK